MKSQLITLAIAGLLAASQARGETANVTLYGRLNLSMEVVNGKQSGDNCPASCPNPNVFRVNSNSSMFGLRGTEYLGRGLTAIFQLENQVFPDTGGGVLAGRESFLGLQGQWGTVKLGYFLAPYDDILPIFGNAPTLTTSILSTAALWAQGYLGQPVNGGFDDRLRNSIRYDTPTISGFTASLQYGANDGSVRSNSSNISGGAFYSNGPLQLGIAYETHNRIRGTAFAPLSDNALSIAGGYQFPSIRIAGVYEKLKYDATPTTDLKRDFYGISSTIDAGPGLFYLFMGRAGDGKGSAVNGTRIGGLAKGDNTGARQWEVSYTYVMSERTLAYAGYVKIQNESNASYTFNSNLYPTLCGNFPNSSCGKPGGFVIGMAHFF